MNDDIDIKETSFWLALNTLKNTVNSEAATSLVNGLKNINLGKCTFSDNAKFINGKNAISSLFGGGGSLGISEFIDRMNRFKDKLAIIDEEVGKKFEYLDTYLENFATDFAYALGITDYNTRYNVLKAMPDYYDKCIGLLSSGYTKHIQRDKQGRALGTVYLPPNYVADGTSAMIIALNGRESAATKQSNPIPCNYGLQALMENGYDPSAVVYVPMFNGGSWLADTDGLYNRIMETANKYNVDQDKKSLIGFSGGGYGVTGLLKLAPNEFSAAVIVGNDINDSNVRNGYEAILNSSTQVIIVNNVSDNVGNRVINLYEENKAASSNVTMYNISGVDHTGSINAIICSDLINDITNIERGQKYTTSYEPISVDTNILKSNSLILGNSNGINKSWYQSLSNVGSFSDKSFVDEKNISKIVSEIKLPEEEIFVQDKQGPLYDYIVRDESPKMNEMIRDTITEKVNDISNKYFNGLNNENNLFRQMMNNFVDRVRKSFVINKNTYSNYVKFLRESGYILDKNGSWINGNRRINIVSMDDGNTMKINFEMGNGDNK